MTAYPWALKATTTVAAAADGEHSGGSYRRTRRHQEPRPSGHGCVAVYVACSVQGASPTGQATRSRRPSRSIWSDRDKLHVPRIPQSAHLLTCCTALGMGMAMSMGCEVAHGRPCNGVQHDASSLKRPSKRTERVSLSGQSALSLPLPLPPLSSLKEKGQQSQRRAGTHRPHRTCCMVSSLLQVLWLMAALSRARSMQFACVLACGRLADQCVHPCFRRVGVC